MLQDLTKFLVAHDKVLEYDLQCMSQSHLTRLRSPEDIQIQKEFFQNIQVSVGKSNQEVSLWQ
ncbi:MAG: hypothetical protein OEL84_02300 [Nitrosopumilus sp.]|nr:hypothetical protein [Nitrosopumilus sp.]MDH3340099.1 hypothetical protein [Nitrosopumilus sp.]